ncbi:MAG TPA: hypothetical protein DD413_04585 [Ruminococcus sp.]|nr:hypothetical protein [Ruminococcus sp.]
MKEKLCKIKNSINRSSHSKYGFLLSIVALVEIIMIIAVSTFSWVETISSIKISNEGKIAQIDTYTYTDAEVGSNYNKTINLSDYFRASGNAHLSAASSADGLNFFFPRVASVGNNAQVFRKGTINDKNTNYISFSFKVKAKGNNQNFFFSKVPTFKADNVEITDKNDIRLAISVADSNGNAESTRIYSYVKANEKVVADPNGTTVQESSICAFKDFIDNKSTNPNHILFSVGADETKTVTITMWLQNFSNVYDYSGKTISSQDFQIVTATKMTQITFVDKTSRFNSTTSQNENTWQWIGNDNAEMWVRTAANKNFKMKPSTTVAENQPPEWTVSLPADQLGDENGDMYFYRTDPSVSDPQINHLNYWKTKFADSRGHGVNPTYSAYGARLQDTKLVYGTWGYLSEIRLLGEDQNVLPTPSSAEALNITKVTMKNSNNISVEMNYNKDFWRAFIPQDEASRNLTFSFKGYNINASNRDIDEDISTYCVTSSSTGYWLPPAVVKVAVYESHSNRGSVSVSGGAVGAQQVKVTKGTTVTVTASPKADYAFEGWYKDEACTEKAEVGSGSSFNLIADSTTDEYIFYAKFQYNVQLTSYTDDTESGAGGKVQINDGTSGAKVSAPVKDGDPVVLKAITANDNYAFEGWYDTNNNKITDDDGNHITTPKINITSLNKPINYRASFKVNTFTLKAYAKENGGVRFSNETDTSYKNYAETTVKFTDKVKFMANPNSAEGYEFKGWYSDEACVHFVSDKLEFEVDKNFDHKILYAKFELKKYIVKAVAVKGTGPEASDEVGTVQITVGANSTASGKTAEMTNVTHGSEVTFKATAKPDSGYKFIGWYDSKGIFISDKAEYTTKNGIADNITYYARFTKRTTIYFTDSFAEEDRYDAYAAYLYQGGNQITGVWPGTLISPDVDGTITTDEETGYCVYFDDSENLSGAFNVIINNNDKGSKYPGYGDGLKGTFGNTYFFDKTKGSNDVMNAFDPISVGIDAATFNASNERQPNGFAGGTIKVGFNTYDAVKRLSRQRGDYFYATPQPANGYKFAGWFTDESCTAPVDESDVTDGKLKIVPHDGVTYYAKFVESASIKLYLKPNSNWNQQRDGHDPRFAAYFMDSNKSGDTAKWVSMTQVDNGCYEVVIPEGDWKYVIFCRMNGSTTANNWDNKWNQTLDLDIPTDVTNCYTVQDNTGDKGGGTWSTY